MLQTITLQLKHSFNTVTFQVLCSKSCFSSLVSPLKDRISLLRVSQIFCKSTMKCHFLQQKESTKTKLPC